MDAYTMELMARSRVEDALAEAEARRLLRDARRAREETADREPARPGQRLPLLRRPTGIISGI